MRIPHSLSHIVDQTGRRLNKNKKLVNKLAKSYDAFLASEASIKEIPRLLGPGISKGMSFASISLTGRSQRIYAAGKFPTPVSVSHAEDLTNKLNEVRSTIKFQLQKVLCLGVAVGRVQMTVLGNVMLSACPHHPYTSSLLTFAHSFPVRHQVPRLAPQEEVAKHQVSSHQVDDEQARPSLLRAHRLQPPSFPWTFGDDSRTC